MPKLFDFVSAIRAADTPSIDPRAVANAGTIRAGSVAATVHRTPRAGVRAAASADPSELTDDELYAALEETLAQLDALIAEVEKRTGQNSDASDSARARVAASTSSRRRAPSTSSATEADRVAQLAWGA